METYADTGQVRFEYKHFAFLGNESIRAAEASECANEQGQFWQYHDTLFLNQLGENMGTFSDSALENFAAALGLDEAAFNSCLDSRAYRDEINAEKAAGGDLGVTSTPTLVVNGRLIEGGPSFEELRAIVESELAGGSTG